MTPTPEETDTIYKSGLKSGINHSQMSPETKEALALIKKDMDYLKQEINELKETMNKFIEKCDECYVSKESFDPVKKITYGLVGAVLLSFVGAVIALILK